jgi:hypothetical protein
MERSKKAKKSDTTNTNIINNAKTSTMNTEVKKQVDNKKEKMLVKEEIMKNILENRQQAKETKVVLDKDQLSFLDKFRKK